MIEKLKIKNKIICITGANGLVGRNLVNELLKHNCIIKIILKTQPKNFSEKINFYIGDLSQPDLNLQPFLKGCDIFINCAAEKINIAKMKPLHIDGVSRIITAIKKNFLVEKKKVHFIQISSCGVYGTQNFSKIQEKRYVDENFNPNPKNQYEKTKLESDDLLINFNEKHIISYTILRPSNIICSSDKNSRLSQLKKYMKFRFFFYFGIKDSIANYVHINDVTKAILTIMNNKKSFNNIYNLSGNYNWHDIINSILYLNHHKIVNIRLPYNLVKYPLLIVKYILKKIITFPTFAALASKTIFSSKKIQIDLNFKFEKLLPESIQDFLCNEIKKNTNNLSRKKSPLSYCKLGKLSHKIEKYPAISVIMTVYNSERFLDESIKSVLDQTFKNFEFIIVNDGSTDSSLKIIQKFAQDDKRIKVINKLNTGITHSLNCAIDQAKGEWIARIDGNDRCRKDRFMLQYQRACSDFRLVLIGSACHEIDSDGKRLKFFKYPESHADLYNSLINMRKFFPHSSYFIRSESVKKIKGYKLLMTRSQDYDLSLRLSELGNICCISEPLIDLRRHKFSISFNDKITKQVIFSRISLICYYLRKVAQGDPLDDNISKSHFKYIKDIITVQFDLSNNKIFNIILKKLINYNRFIHYDNLVFCQVNKEKILKNFFELSSKSIEQA